VHGVHCSIFLRLPLFNGNGSGPSSPLQKRISYETLESKYNQRTNVLSRTLIFLLVPIFAALFYALFL